MNRISKLRFDALAGYHRHPMATVTGEELGWFEAGSEKVLGILIRDRTDGDFSSVVLGRDRKGRFCAVDVPPFEPTVEEAEKTLTRVLDDWAGKDDTAFNQGDESGQPVDFFAPVVPEDRLHKSYSALLGQEGYSPAQELISAMMFYFDDPDGNFVEQFQTTAFDARLWELYLFATFTELNFAFDRSQPAPDYRCLGIGAEVFVEAMTVNPTIVDGKIIQEEVPADPEPQARYLREYLPIKFGSALFSKLQKRYWEKSHVSGKPLVFAIQDFHQEGSMIWSQTGLLEYLFGARQHPEYESDGTLKIVPERIDVHRWGDKEIPSGFFFQEGAENVSAVIFNTSGTMSKFNRMGWLAGFGSRRVRMQRMGTCYDHSPNAAVPAVFNLRVHDPTYKETWAEGLNVVHNPRAAVPIPEYWLPGVGHHYLRDDVHVAYLPDFHPYGSITAIWVDQSAGDEVPKNQLG